MRRIRWRSSGRGPLYRRCRQRSSRCRARPPQGQTRILPSPWPFLLAGHRHLGDDAPGRGGSPPRRGRPTRKCRLRCRKAGVVLKTPLSLALPLILSEESPFLAESPVQFVPLVYALTSPSLSEKGRVRSRAVKANFSPGFTSNSALIAREKTASSGRSFTSTVTVSPASIFVGDMVTEARRCGRDQKEEQDHKHSISFH